MNHRPYIRRIPHSDTALVLIHGILGSPDHFDFLMPLIPSEYSLYNILLDGHGGRVEEFSRTSMDKWQMQVRLLLDEVLEKHEKVILVAHSMGTLFSIQESIRRPEKIKGLFLLQVPLYPRLSLTAAVHSTLLALGIRTKKAQMMEKDTSLQLSPLLWKYLGWLPRFFELFALCRRTRKVLQHITVPCRAYQSCKDELVSNRSEKLLRRHANVEVTALPHSGHFGHEGAERDLVREAFAQALEIWTRSGEQG